MRLRFVVTRPFRVQPLSVGGKYCCLKISCRSTEKKKEPAENGKNKQKRGAEFETQLII